jgi:hypothetical protein
MPGTIAALAFLALTAPQEPWRTDVRAAREDAVRKRRPCVLLLYVDGQ